MPITFRRRKQRPPPSTRSFRYALARLHQKVKCFPSCAGACVSARLLEVDMSVKPACSRRGTISLTPYILSTSMSFTTSFFSGYTNQQCSWKKFSSAHFSVRLKQSLSSPQFRTFSEGAIFGFPATDETNQPPGWRD